MVKARARAGGQRARPMLRGPAACISAELQMALGACEMVRPRSDHRTTAEPGGNITGTFHLLGMYQGIGWMGLSAWHLSSGPGEPTSAWAWPASAG